MIILDILKIAFWMFFSASAAGIAILYAIRWYDLSLGRFSPARSWMDALVERGWRPVKAYFAELIYYMIYAFLYLIGMAFWLAGRRGHIPSGRDTSAGAPLIVLIHGLIGTAANMWILRFRLSVRGIKNIAVYDYLSTGGTFQDNRDLLRDFIFKAADQTGAEGVTLIGHSMGGLIAHDYAMEYGAQRGGVKALITLGTPYRGSRLAALGVSAAARALHPANPYFATVAARKPDAPIFCLGAVFDEMVIPFTNFSHPMASFSELVETCGHAGLIYDGQAFGRIVEWLRGVLPEKPGDTAGG